MYYQMGISIFILYLIFVLFHVTNALLTVKYYKNKEIRFDIEKKKMSILIPCYNESDIIRSTIYGMKDMLRIYPNSEYIFINDGSNDDTLNVLIEELNLTISNQKNISEIPHKKILNIYTSTIHNNIYVIDKENGGKADSLNAGINFSSSEIIITLDADTLLHKNSLDAINNEFQDENVIAGGGIVNIIQGKEYAEGKLILKDLALIVRFQITEYLRGFIITKSSLARCNAMMVISGAFGAFKRDILIKVGGYRNTIGEDIDITMKFQKYAIKHKNKKIIFMPNAIAYTECPTNWKDLLNQRIRWQKAFMDCCILYFGTLMKLFFRRGIAILFIVDALFLSVLMPIFTLFTSIYLVTVKINQIHYESLFILWGISILVYIIVTVVALYIFKSFGGKISRNSYLSLVTTVLNEIMIFRLFTILYITMGSLLYFVNKDNWNKVSRTGDVYYSKGA